MPNAQRRLGNRLATAGLIFIGLLTLIPAPGQVARAAATPILCLICGDHGGVDFSLNILLFVPLGLGLGLGGFSWRRVLFLAALTTCTIELLQMKVIVGRDASLGDIVANTAGGGIGVLIAARWRSLVYPDAPRARQLAWLSAVTLCAIWSCTAWAFGPSFPTDSRWFGAWAPELGNYDRFQGIPLSVAAGGEPLLPGPALGQQRLMQAVATDPSITFRAVLGPQPSDLAPVGLIVDGRRRDIIFIGQERQDLAFNLRLRSNLVKLRSPQVNLRDGMAGQPGDTVDAGGLLQDGVFVLNSRIGEAVRTRTLPVSASWGWSLVTPWNSVLGEEVHHLTALWIIGLVGTMAYWSFLSKDTTIALIPATIVLLIAIIPYATGLPPAHWSEWAASATAALLGAIGAKAARRATERNTPD